MNCETVVVSLPIADRRAAYAFYGEGGLGLEPIGELADDGVPEPLQFALSEGLRLMLIPTVGFGWVTGNHEVAEAGTSECIVTVAAKSEDEADALIERARGLGAEVVTEPGRQPWGYAAAFADLDGHLWMVRCED